MGIKGCKNQSKCAAIREGWSTLDDKKDEVARLTQLLRDGPPGRDWDKGEESRIELAKNILEPTIAPFENNLRQSLDAIRALGHCANCPLR